MPFVPVVDLTDPEREPSDEELEALMQSVRDKVVESNRRAANGSLRTSETASPGRRRAKQTLCRTPSGAPTRPARQSRRRQ